MIDKCMRNLIEFINKHSNMLKVRACCCGHYKYPMSIIVENLQTEGIYELMSGRHIPGKRKFYKRDKQGYYYIQEGILR